jgi:hypothetical protein
LIVSAGVVSTAPADFFWIEAMRSFEVSGMSPAEFVSKITSEINAREFERYVSIQLDGDDLEVNLRWMGTTRFDYRVLPVGDGFRAELTGQRVAPLHAAFSDRFEGYFEKVLAKVGARVV